MKTSNDQRIRQLQIARDKADTEFWNKTWWGPAALKLRRRADSLSECKIVVVHSSGNYPTVQFRVESETPTIYRTQSFYLRNQWDADKTRPDEQSYWYDDVGDWMRGAFDDDEQFQQTLDNQEEGSLFKNATEEQKSLDIDQHGFHTVGTIRQFTKDEKDIVANCVLPTVRRLDEVFSTEGKSAEDFGYRIGKKIDHQSGEDSNGCWDTEIFGIDKTLKLRMFKALHLLSIHAF